MSVSLDLSAIAYLRREFLEQITYWLARFWKNPNDRIARSILQFYQRQIQELEEDGKQALATTRAEKMSQKYTKKTMTTRTPRRISYDLEYIRS